MCSVHQCSSFFRPTESHVFLPAITLSVLGVWGDINNLWVVLNPVLHQYFQFSFLWNLLKTPLLFGRQCKFNHRGRAQDSKLACPICGWDSTLFQKKKKIFLCQLSRDPSRGGVFCFIAVLQLGVVRNSMAPLETRETFAWGVVPGKYIGLFHCICSWGSFWVFWNGLSIDLKFVIKKITRPNFRAKEF